MGNHLNKTILVTGGAGFIGSNLCDRFLSEGFNVLCLDNFDDFYNKDIKHNNLKAAKENKNFRLIEGDIRDYSLINNLFSENTIDIVVHLAARAGVRPSISNPSLYFDVNVNGTITLLESMNKHDVKKLVFASSSSVYGNNTKVPFSENDNVDFPISPYAASKKAGELICYVYHHLHHFDIFCLRFFTVYGPRQRPEMAIHNFTKKIINNEPLDFFGDGNTKRDYTYIDDIVSGILNATKQVKGYEIINLGEYNTVTLSYLIKLIEEAIGKKAQLNKLPIQPGDVETTFADISKANALLSYNPQFPIEKGIEKFVQWYIEQKQN